MRDIARAWLIVAGEYLRAVRRLLRTAAEGVSESDADPDGEAVPAWAEASPGAVPNAAPTNPYEAERSVRTRTRRTARDRQRGGGRGASGPHHPAKERPRRLSRGDGAGTE